MGCIKNINCGSRVIVGIRDYNHCANPESSLFINDIPGITLKGAAAIANDEQKSGYELLNSITKRAVQMVFEEFNAKATSLFQFNAIAEVRKLNYWDGTILPVNANERGLVMKRWRSEMAQIFVEELYIKSQVGGAATVKIIDGTETKSFTITLVANEEYILRTDYIATNEQIKIVMDNTTFPVYSGPIAQEYTGCRSCNGGASQGLYFVGWNGTGEEGRYYGIGAKASVRCYEENILCMLLPRMNFIIWYKAGIMYYEELLASNRLNPITIYSKDQAKENLAKLEDKYEEAFKNFIPTIKNFIISTKGECLTCNSPIRHANTLRV